MHPGKKEQVYFFLRIIIPSLIAMGLFIIGTFSIIVPAFKSAMMERKKEMIKELTMTAISSIDSIYRDYTKGLLTETQAKSEAASKIADLKYGNEGKDYFWISDIHKKMIIHPYKPELNGTDLSNYEDSAGKKLFVEFVNIVEKQKEGYVDYMWQWNDTPKIVPKLSYVKLYEHWGWIIGTGIYLEDVAAEIATLTSRLIRISLIIFLVITLLLSFILTQSMKVEKNKLDAEKKLLESREKYRTLVESSTEGTLMFLENGYMYANNTMLSMLDYQMDELHQLKIEDIFLTQNADSGFENFQAFMGGQEAPMQFDAILKKKGGEPLSALLYPSRINIGGNSGYTLIAKDMSYQKQIQGELGESKEKLRSLIENIHIGIFRAQLKDGQIQEANPALIKILGFQDKKELLKLKILDLFYEEGDKSKFLTDLTEKGQVKDRILNLKKEDGTQKVISLSCNLMKSDETETYFDGFIEDITQQREMESHKEALISELQTSLLFLNQPVTHFLKKIQTCPMHWTVKKAAALMSEKKQSALIVISENDEHLGIITDHDLRERVIAQGYDLERPAFEIMSSPIRGLQENALVFQAVLTMQEKEIRHLAVKNSAGKVTGIISQKDLLKIQWHSSSFLIEEIKNADDVDEIAQSRKRLPGFIQSLIRSGAHAKNITSILSEVSNQILAKVIGFALDELGKPPVEFSFLVLGSEGREEETLITDQDNAILYQDVPAEQKEAVKNYFLKLAQKVNFSLNEAGYHYCKGEVMAKNPKWCLSLSEWKEQFNQWIINSQPQDTLEMNIFFDFRNGFGNQDLVNELRQHVNQKTEGKTAFFYNLTQNSLYYKPPIGFFGQIVVESSGEHKEAFSIKEAIKPIINFARIYALQHKIDQTNTLERLKTMQENQFLQENTYQEIVHAYNYLMKMRFENQVNRMDENLEPDNYINPKKLTDIEQAMLKNIFSQITVFQSKLKNDFIGARG